MHSFNKLWTLPSSFLHFTYVRPAKESNHDIYTSCLHFTIIIQLCRNHNKNQYQQPYFTQSQQQSKHLEPILTYAKKALAFASRITIPHSPNIISIHPQTHENACQLRPKLSHPAGLDKRNHPKISIWRTSCPFLYSCPFAPYTNSTDHTL